ncbi:glycoside hydrolase family 130 protein [Novosphingobium sp. ZW T3_23]|uniref:glycoside hydrolase family 130 protein n=1 Tax=Novosphingobium sp. ZW T3_23 TaxID=3378084 RepID=UPI0038531E0A
MEAAEVFTKLKLELRPDPGRTVIRPFHFEYPPAFAGQRPPRPRVIVERLLSLENDVRERMIGFVMGPMQARHRNAEAVFLRQIEGLEHELGDISGLNRRDRLLLGAYLSQEYSFESAALFNPSIVRLPMEEEAAAKEDGVRFLLSLRGIGEGHISSVTFRTGCWDGGETVTIDAASPNCFPPRIESDNEGWVRLQCEDSREVSETVIFPVLANQRQGVEDLRMVVFTEDDGQRFLIGTYTAYDGLKTRQEILRGVDLRTFEMRPLSGDMTGYKGMALFPRKIDGRYVMLGRQDGENIWLLRSEDLFTWQTGTPIMAPAYPWEFVQLGNCGSPIEIEEGWLVFTHGVGMVRGYCIGACLLNRDDPSRVLMRTRAPLIFPSAEQHGGYVPNVTYSCGALVHNRRVLLPYGVGDELTAFAVADLDDLLSVLVPA